jgi:hypothetical protein
LPFSSDRVRRCVSFRFERGVTRRIEGATFDDYDPFERIYVQDLEVEALATESAILTREHPALIATAERIAS